MYKGRLHGNWAGGKRMIKGYPVTYMPDHPRATPVYVLDHILVAEKALGKPLPERAEVHHANGSRDSGPLVIC